MLTLFTITLLLWVGGYFLLPRLRPPAARPPGVSAATVSLIIPARNEAHNLPKLLASIGSQAEQALEIIVVDDDSSDGTAEVAANMGATVIASQPLPDDWRGKTWACHQGAQAAKGEHLCFLDADTWFEPDGLKQVLSQYHGGAFSICPWHQVIRPHEQLSLFFNLAMVVGTVPHGLFGQMLLVTREHYQMIGGHESVRTEILENFHLAEAFHAADIPVCSGTGKGILSFRMYPNGLRDLIEGWTKGFASGAGKTSRPTLAIMIAWMSGLMITPMALCLSGASWPWAALYLLYALQVKHLARQVGSFSWLTAILYPIPLVFFFGLFACSAAKDGRNVSWKGRRIRGH